jgi:integrase
MTTTLKVDHPSNSSSNSNRAYYNFVNSIKSLETRRIYEFIIKKYMQFHNLQTIDELLSLPNNNKDNPTIIEDKIIDWLVSLRETITYGTRRTYLSALVLFYEINDISIRKKRIAKFLGQESTRKHKDRAYTTEEIRKILDYADIRSKALVLLLASSGIRIGAVSELKIRHLKKIPEYNLYRITVYENAREEYYTFCTPECAIAIDNYLEYRQKSGEKITEGAPLIRECFDKVIIHDINNNENTAIAKRKTKFLTTYGIGGILSNLMIKSEINGGITPYLKLEALGQKQRGSERKAVKRTHGLRKYVLTTLVNTQVDPVVRRMLLGHDIGLDQNYFKPTEQKILQEYLKAVDALTINNENRLKRQVVELTEKQSDIELIKLEQRQKDNKIKDLEDKMKIQENATALQNHMLELIAQSMEIDTTALKQKLVEDKATLPKDQYEDMEYQHKKRGLEIAERLKEKIMKDTLIPEINNISKNIIKDPKSASDSVKKVVNNKELSRYRKELHKYNTTNPIDAYVYGYDNKDNDSKDD